MNQILSGGAGLIYASGLLFVAGLFVGMLACMEAGRRLGRRQLARDPKGAREGISAVEGAMFALLGLLIAFTFSGAASRFDQRRDLLVRETNAIGTAYQLIDLLPAGDQSIMRDKFRQYVGARLSVYRAIPDLEAVYAGLARSTELQNEIWSRSVALTRDAPSPAVTTLVLGALSEMSDIVTIRTVALQTHPPLVIFAMLGVLGLTCALLAGYGMAESSTRNWIHPVVFAATTVLTIYVILDLEFPRVGLIRIDSFDQLLVDLLESMK